MRIIAAALLLLAACSSQPGESATPAPAAAVDAGRHPVSGLEIVPLTITGKSGTHRFRVEVARTGQEQARGLMFRTEMGPDEGMIFPHESPRQASFWMKNTVIPLDIIFIGSDGTILNIDANAVPYSLEPRPSAGLTKGVLELNGGRAAALGIAPGDRVEW